MLTVLESGARLEVFDKIDSTSAEASRRVQSGERGPLWLMALEQSDGYGRRGTPWSHSKGNLAATYIFRNSDVQKEFISDAAQLSFVAAVALKETFSEFAPWGAFSLKWPNDALLEGRKISGLLLELKNIGNEFIFCLGIGVNLADAPASGGRHTACLREVITGPLPGPQEFLARFDAAFYAWHINWLRHGFTQLRDAWLASAHGIGGTITLEIPSTGVSDEKARRIIGEYRGIDDQGSILVHVDGKDCAFSAGSLFFETD